MSNFKVTKMVTFDAMFMGEDLQWTITDRDGYILLVSGEYELAIDKYDLKAIADMYPTPRVTGLKD